MEGGLALVFEYQYTEKGCLFKAYNTVMRSPAEHTVKGHINYKFMQTEKKTSTELAERCRI